MLAIASINVSEYTVRLRRTEAEEVDVVVDAESEEDAISIAKKIAESRWDGGLKQVEVVPTEYLED